MNEWNVSAWQASSLGFFKLFREKLMLATNRNECTHVQPPKELTTEALSMIVLMSIFIIFAVLGNLSTAFEFIYEENTERKKLSKNTDNKNFTNNLSKKDWLSNIRSFLHCFCSVKNGKKLFRADPGEQQFQCFYGIRVISNISIICGHIILFTSFPQFCSSKGSAELKTFFPSLISKHLTNPMFAVDAFFVLSGFLTAYSFSKVYDKNNGRINWWQFYLKRLLRLTPIYMIMFGFYTTLLCYTGSGPIWPQYTTNPICMENWWRYLLYINNFELSEKSCMVWLWYVAVEMQFYVVSPIFLVSLLRWQRFGYSLTSITIFLSSVSSFLITKRFNLIHCSFVQLDIYIDDLETFSNRLWVYFDILYIKPYARISAYLIGVLLGYYFHDKNFKDIKTRWITLCFGWITAGILIWISFYALLKREESVLEIALYNSVKHLFFSVGLSWIIFVCLTEQGSAINAFLSWKIFYPFSKLSYCTYLIHMFIIQRDSLAAQELEEFSLLSVVLYCFRVYFWTLVFSIPVSLLFEMPVINLINLYLKKEERKEKTKKKLS